MHALSSLRLRESRSDLSSLLLLVLGLKFSHNYPRFCTANRANFAIKTGKVRILHILVVYISMFISDSKLQKECRT